jgi:hypothetical protein
MMPCLLAYKTFQVLVIVEWIWREVQGVSSHELGVLHSNGCASERLLSRRPTRNHGQLNFLTVYKKLKSSFRRM